MIAALIIGSLVAILAFVAGSRWRTASRTFSPEAIDAVLDAATRDRMKARVMEQIREGEL